MISTCDLSLLPEIERLRRLMQSMAMLDAILCPEWEFRYYSFDSAWSAGEQMGSMRDGSGDHFFGHFGPHGCWIKGFAHESPMSPYCSDPERIWPGVIDTVPVEFSDCLREPAFIVENVTFCVWRRYSDPAWQVGPIEFPRGEFDPDGSEELLSALDGKPETYQAWAQGYYEREVSMAVIEKIYRHEPLTTEMVALLNPDVTLAELAADSSQIRYNLAAP